MSIPSASFWLAGPAYLLLLAGALYKAPWVELRGPRRLNSYLGALVTLLVLWSIRTGGLPGHEFHFLGATALTLMFGWALALVGTSLVLAGSTVNAIVMEKGSTAWAHLPVEALVSCALPVLVTIFVFRLAVRGLPLHFFVYVFVCAFAGGGLSMAVHRVAGAALLAQDPAGSGGSAMMETLSYLPLMALPEAFLNGMVITLLVVYKPEWVTTFDDQRYLEGK